MNGAPTPMLAALAAVWLLSGTAHAHGAVGMKEIIGTWKLLAFEDRSESGEVRYHYGAHPKGLLIYDALGHMSVQIMKVPPPKVASGDEDRVTAAEKVALFDAYTAYFGTYAVDVERGIITHHVDGDLADVYIGRAEQRPFELSGDRLIIKPIWTTDGKRWEGVRIFERAK
ncbi:MAG: lipocalin-like domain-containing protein [Steroidobacteraceae bacterium]